ncbi:MAG TPA: DUF6334 family protein [Allosphingosinicella sp.]|nr:DUF6334 family protein [Allosphingosinicella sp.]
MGTGLRLKHLSSLKRLIAWDKGIDDMAHTVLQFDYEEVHGLKLLRAEGVGGLPMNDGSMSYDSIRLILADGITVSINSSENTDEIVVEKITVDAEYGLNVASDNELAFTTTLCGHSLGWCWVGVNWRGYKDTFLVSFETVDPQLAFVAMASRVHCYRLVAQG